MMTPIVLYSDSFRMSLAETLRHEGLFSNHEDDPGGVTMLGMTRKSWARLTGRKLSEVSIEEMEGLTVERVMPFYHSEYWLAVRADELPGGLDFVVWDVAVNSGPSRSIRMLQKAINRLSRIQVRVDGRIGPKTLSAARRLNVFALINEMGKTRLWFYFDLSTFKTFGRGWVSRLIDVTSFGTAMALGRAEAMIRAA